MNKNTVNKTTTADLIMDRHELRTVKEELETYKAFVQIVADHDDLPHSNEMVEIIRWY